MANIAAKYKRWNGTDWDTIYLSTIASQVITVASGQIGYDTSNQFVNGTQKDALNLTNLENGYIKSTGAGFAGTLAVPDLNIVNLQTTNANIATSIITRNLDQKLTMEIGVGGGEPFYYFFTKTALTLPYASPLGNNDATTKSYVDNLALGAVKIKQQVRVATTANLASLSGTLTIDGVVLVSNDRVLVKNQTATDANGIYIVAAGAWTRSTDADSFSELNGALVNVAQGDVNIGDTFYQSSTLISLASAQTWVLFTNFNNYTASQGITLSGVNFRHTNAITANPTIGVYKSAYDAQGHLIGTPTLAAIQDLSNVQVTSPVVNQLLAWNGTKFANTNIKNSVFYGTTTPTAISLNDIWIDTN